MGRCSCRGSVLRHRGPACDRGPRRGHRGGLHAGTGDARWPLCTAGEGRPAPAMPPCTPARPAPCPMPCAPSRPTAGSSPSSPCCAALTMTWLHRSPRSATASAACSRRSIPRLTRVVGPRLEHAAVAELLMRHPSPAQLAACGEEQLQRELKPLAPRLYKRLARDIMQALSSRGWWCRARIRPRRQSAPVRTAADPARSAR